METWQRIDAATPEAAQEMFQRACGSERWVRRMVARRPFRSASGLRNAARREWLALGEADWLEAFSHHPKIGDRASLAERFPATHDLSAKEQSAFGEPGADVIEALAQANESYLERFGFIFVVCATGQTAGQMLKMLHDRLTNERPTELRLAVEEQAKITALRLE